MLKTIDVLIGLAVVMLLMSMIVTAATQFVLSVLNSRGKHLRKGIADIVQQISPNVKRPIAEEIAGAVLTHPLIRDANGRFGSVIHREELTKLLLEAASGEGIQTISADAKTALQRTLVETGMCQPGTPEEIEQQIRATVKNVGELALQLELSHPELTNAARARIAILQQAGSGFVAKINLWFDQTIDRISDRFTHQTRFVTFTTGLLLALIIQLDTAGLVSRLASDDNLRASLVAQAQTTSAPQDSSLKLDDSELQNVRDLMTNNVMGVPLSFSDWMNRWSRDNALMKLFGILLSAALLSFGAPFWYNALQNLLRLRSLAAAKDDQQRSARQLASSPGSTVTVTSASTNDRSIIADERGDLAIVA